MTNPPNRLTKQLNRRHGPISLSPGRSATVEEILAIAHDAPQLPLLRRIEEPGPPRPTAPLSRYRSLKQHHGPGLPRLVPPYSHHWRPVEYIQSQESHKPKSTVDQPLVEGSKKLTKKVSSPREPEQALKASRSISTDPSSEFRRYDRDELEPAAQHIIDPKEHLTVEEPETNLLELNEIQTDHESQTEDKSQTEE
ncbi:hypothetical protein K474DRAFT_1710757 [Panus rudis PR-1116 ss-1]|nr:hypothetical protein K474DRAFT_1710757 [Panus rudis PR-1116 ss-1]